MFLRCCEASFSRHPRHVPSEEAWSGKSRRLLDTVSAYKLSARPYRRNERVLSPDEHWSQPPGRVSIGTVRFYQSYRRPRRHQIILFIERKTLSQQACWIRRLSAPAGRISACGTRSPCLSCLFDRVPCSFFSFLFPTRFSTFPVARGRLDKTWNEHGGREAKGLKGKEESQRDRTTRHEPELSGYVQSIATHLSLAPTNY